MSIAPDKNNNSQIAEQDFAEKVSRGLTTFTSGTVLVVIGFAVGAFILLFDYFHLKPEDLNSLKHRRSSCFF